jgi:hypothetical protein
VFLAPALSPRLRFERFERWSEAAKEDRFGGWVMFLLAEEMPKRYEMLCYMNIRSMNKLPYIYVFDEVTF